MTPAQWRMLQRNLKHTEEGCWLWQGEGTKDGYGMIRFPGQPRRMTHVVTFEQFNGPVPAGCDVGHICHDESVIAGTCEGGPGCRHRRCCNPAHLAAQTRSENTLAQNHANRRKTHCPNGHEYTTENTIETSQGRKCRECDRARKRTT